MKRYVLEADKYIIEETFGVSSNSDTLYEPNYNVMMGHSMPIIVEEDGKRQIITSTWGLSLKDSKQDMNEIDYERLSESESLRSLAKQTPCIIPASGFYKWKETVDDPLPFYLRILSQEVTGFAGVYNNYKNTKGQKIHSYAVLTMPANALVEPLDDTMPVVLDPGVFSKWLNGEALNMVEKGFSGNHLLPDMSVFRVPELVNDPSNNSKELVQPIPKLRNYDED
ncbi:MAG TPA: SOS response-associated peptidase family protein [Gracilimonas sp.]|uniref:SOS response-associated peptidase n=1 Tax=Gracilimonas sp. TaxID=1974203 RepID=UPI002D9D02BC|nr:SOS response-associated peptidase family protein [Gracilimonas sp.]